jgi:predicted 3-demethylubiquinone-9 3-methyltransferase (glyoxalase superfamily)
MPFFLFSQNNSGGSFIVNDKVAEYVIIEANKASHANSDAEEIGIYFSGVSTGDDCGCCGDRWGRLLWILVLKSINETLRSIGVANYISFPAD